MTLTPEQIAEGWRLHDGSDVCPIKDSATRLQVIVGASGPFTPTEAAYPCKSWTWRDIQAYRIIEAHGADAEPARPTPFPRDYSELVWDADGWSQPFFTDGVWPEWLPDDAEWRFAPGGFAWHGRKAFDGEFAIRVRRRELKRETVQCSIMFDSISPVAATIDLIDGKPDLSTLKIAEDAL